MSDERETEVDHGSVEVSFLAVKAKLPANGSPHKPPKSWRELWKKTKEHLLAIADTPLALTATLCSGLVSVASGVSNIFTRAPIETYEEAAEAVEAPKAIDTASSSEIGTTDVASPRKNEQLEAAKNKLRGVIEGLTERGIAVEIRRLPDGRVLVLGTHPEEVDTVAELVENRAIPRLDADLKSSPQSSSFDRPVGDWDLSINVIRALAVAGIRSIGQLVCRTSDELLAIHGIGPKTIERIRDELGALGLGIATRINEK